MPIGKYQHNNKQGFQKGNKFGYQKKGPFSKEHKNKLSESHKGKKVPSHSGSNHERWKGDRVGYQALHIWVRRQLGTPKYCACCFRDDMAVYEWANISHCYKRDLSDWIRLCRSCHRLYDLGKINL